LPIFFHTSREERNYVYVLLISLEPPEVDAQDQDAEGGKVRAKGKGKSYH
jgi:hypothetical protein